MLWEPIALEMGGDPKDVQLFPLQDLLRPGSAPLHNYFSGGAQSGFGFKQQVRAVRRQAEVCQSLSNVDLLISAGANDVLDQLEHNGAFMAVLETEDRRDDRRLMRRNAKASARNFRSGIDRLTGLVIEAVVIGSFPLLFKPTIQLMAAGPDPGSFERLTEIVDGINKLTRHVASDRSVVVLNLKVAWDRLEAYSLIDAVHPSSETNRQLAELIVPDLIEQLNS
ncbi:MAG: hypothetical protein VX069_02040 [Cyanobacteriota bacterium]|nr:hypothetical protein [Cyanobacteriota bacterium]